MIHSKTPARIAVAKQDHTFPRRFVVIGAQGRKARRRPQLVRGGDVKRGDLVGRLPRNGRAVNAVARDGVAARAFVVHRHRRVSGRRVQAVIKHEALYSIGVMRLRRDHHRLIGRRHAGRVGHVVNGRTRIAGVLAVGSARRAQVGRHGHRRRGFQPIAVQSKQHLRPAAQPARLVTQRRRVAPGHGIGVQGDLTGIIPSPKLVTASYMQGVTALIAAALQARTRHAALQ